MKKLISLLLTVLLVFSAVMPVFAAENAEVYEKCPMIYIRGTGAPLYDTQGNRVYTGFDVFSADTGEDEDGITTDDILDSVMNVLKPLIVDGLLFDNWDAYGEVLYEELAPLWEEVRLDGNGDTINGINVDAWSLNWSDNYRANENMGVNRMFSIEDYGFVYDWRLSPYDHVDRLHAYIEKVMAATGYDEVCIGARCMGGSLLNAYLEKYGHLGHVKKVFYSEVLSNGCAFISDSFSGKVAFDEKILQTFVKQLEYCGAMGFGTGFVMSDFISELVNSTIDLLVQNHSMDFITGGVECLYNRLYEAFIPAITLATGLATYPNYWASVYEEDFDTALNLIFGEEGSEKRTEYAGLIEKIRYYREHVSSDLLGFYEKINEEYGIEVGVLAKYGYLDAPYTTHNSDISDSLVGLHDASLGATTAPVFTTLSDSYIADRAVAGFGNYISPDRQVDTSTCMFPDTTWIVKNMHHDFGDAFNYIANYFFRFSNASIHSEIIELSQFNILDESATTTDQMIPMTQDNMTDFD